MKKFPLIVLLLNISFAASFGQTSAWRSKVSPEILAALDKGEKVDLLVVFREQADLSAARFLKTKSEKARFVFERLTETAARSQARAIQILKEKNAYANSLYLVNAISVKNADAELTRQIADLQEVKWLGSDPWVKFSGPVESSAAEPAAERGTVEWGVEKINAPAVWALGYTGQGITVGGADTGYDWVHPALQPHYRGWNNFAGTAEHNYNWHDAIHDYSPLNYDTLGNPIGTNPCGFDAPAPCDDGSHGTHTMGTMTGDDGLGNQIGVAPGASWVGCRNMERSWGQPSTYLECFQWFLAPTDLNGENAAPDKAPHVINNSWYCADFEGCTDLTVNELLRTAVINLKVSGVFVVVSNGNEGWAGCNTTANPPGYFEESFSVGSTMFNDTISGFSSRGPVLVDGSGRLKPNVSAPGQNIRSSTPNGGFGNSSGTSMAGPHVAGLVALVLSARPDLAGQVEVVEQIIEETAVPKFGWQDCADNFGQNYPNNTYGYGRVDALAAVNAALAYTVSAPEVQSPEARVFPNPVADEAIFDMKNISGKTTLDVFAADGKLVFSKNWTAQNRELVPVVLKNQPGGVYFWQIKTESGTASGRLAKK
jgi:subtilisin family serine protease